MAACGPVNLGGRTPDKPCLGWFGFCDWDDYAAVRRTLLLEHNALVRGIRAFNSIVGTKTASPRWSKPGVGWKGQTIAPGIITWDTATGAAYDVYEESLALLEKLPEGLASSLIDFSFDSVEAGVVAMLKMSMLVHGAACDLDEALLAAGAPVPQKPEAPPPEKTVTQELLDLGRELGQGLGLLAVGTIVAIAGYNYVTKKGKNRW